MADFEAFLAHSLDPLKDSRVKDAMLYSLMAGGKRIRPRLLFSLLKSFNIPEETGYPVAAAIEMIHTYSLIHDDLPAMDNDTLRRGKPTCHIQFDEATAILAGDALLTQAFAITAQSACSSNNQVALLLALAEYSGGNGMILGQIKDIQQEARKDVSREELLDMFYFKTGKLITLPLVCACILAQRQTLLPIVDQIGSKIGCSFQIQDDILDVTSTKEELGKNINSDLSNDKTTYVALCGIEKAQQEADDLYQEAMQLIDTLAEDTQELKQFIQTLVKRKN